MDILACLISLYIVHSRSSLLFSFFKKFKSFSSPCCTKVLFPDKTPDTFAMHKELTALSNARNFGEEAEASEDDEDLQLQPENDEETKKAIFARATYLEEV